MNIFPEPPLEEYSRQYGVTNVKFWDWDKIMALDIGESFEVLDGSIFQEVLLYNKQLSVLILTLVCVCRRGEREPELRVPVVRQQRRPGPGQVGDS